MNRTEISNALRRFITKFVRGAASFPDDQNIFEAGFVNSLFVMQLILFVESQFQLTVEQDDMIRDNFCNINALTHFIMSKQVAKARS